MSALSAPVDHAAAARERARRSARRTTQHGWLTSLPGIVAVTVLCLVPIVMTLVEAFSAEGLAAARTLLETPVLGRAVRNTVVWTVISVVGAVLIGYGAAFLLQHRAVRWPAVSVSGR